jgi:hypothetical protein
MTNQLLEFRKTHHFIFSQWDRKIDDSTLHKVLPYVKPEADKKKVAIVMPSFLSKRNIQFKGSECFIIVCHDKLLLTAYFCDHPNYLFNKEKNCSFQIIY